MICHTFTLMSPQLMNESIKKSSASVTIDISLKRNHYKQQTEQECFWLDYARKVLDSKAEVESAHTVAMIKHSLHVIKSVIKHLNPGHTPVITFDQPLYALAKQIQWKWPGVYGKDKFLLCLVVFIFKW